MLTIDKLKFELTEIISSIKTLEYSVDVKLSSENGILTNAVTRLGYLRSFSKLPSNFYISDVLHYVVDSFIPLFSEYEDNPKILEYYE